MTFDKDQVREQLTIENIFEVLQDWGGDPEYTEFGIISTTICHNAPGEGSRKLYYYENSGLFKCYTSCDETFDVFQLAIKIYSVQHNKKIDLNSAINLIAFKFGIIADYQLEEEDLDYKKDWDIFRDYERIQEQNLKDYSINLKEYDSIILSRFNYKVKILPWLNDNIIQSVIKDAQIGFYPGGDQITIPHFDADGRFIGLRGRALCKEECERFGKYRPLKINNQLYNHPLSMNLYNLNRSKENIKVLKKAIIFESEKSCLQYRSYFGAENDISVACCGSTVSAHQINLLIEAGAEEIIIGLDRQFQEIGDSEFKRLTAKLTKFHNKYKNYVNISFIFDKKMITGYKDSPTDKGKEIFLTLFNERIIL